MSQIEAVYNEVLQLERAVVCKVDLRTNAFDYISPNVEQLTGFTADECRRAGYVAILSRCHPEDLPEIMAAVEEIGRRPEPQQRQGVIQYRWLDNFGCWRWCRARFRVLTDDGGDPVGLTVCVHEAAEEAEVIQLHGKGLDCVPATLSLQSHTSTSQQAYLAPLDTSGLGLTRIQGRVLSLILSGLSNKQIALRLHRSIRTVEDHRYRIMRKVGAENAVDLVQKVLRPALRKAA